MFSFFRILVLVGIWFVALNVFKRTRATKKKRIVLAIVFSVVLFAESALFPIENLLISFDTPTAVFNYYRTGEGEIVDIIHGDQSCAVIYTEDNNNYSLMIVPEGEQGYKLPSLMTTNKICNELNEYGSFQVNNVRLTNDYFVWGALVIDDEHINVVDKYGNEVKTIINDVEGSTARTVSFFTFTTQYNDDYYILVNGRKISFR